MRKHVFHWWFFNYSWVINAGVDTYFGILRHCWYYPKKVYLRRQAINLTLLKRFRVRLDCPLRFEEHVSLGCVTPLIDFPYPHSASFDRVTGARGETHRPNSRRFATTGWSMSNQQVELITKMICSRQVAMQTGMSLMDCSVKRA